MGHAAGLDEVMQRKSLPHNSKCEDLTTYEVASKIFRTGVVIYTASVVARSTGPNMPNCEFRVLLRRFVATA
jgi:hypothetical protein